MIRFSSRVWINCTVTQPAAAPANTSATVSRLRRHSTRPERQ
jgi:hypothetical protein